MAKSEEPNTSTSEGYVEPREKADPEHRDAGQQYVDRDENQTAREQADEQAKQDKQKQ